LLDIVEQIVQSGAAIKFHKENLEFEGNEKNPFQSLMLNLLSSIAQFERDCLLDRQREGIQIAKSNGKYKGKKSRFSDEDIQQIKGSFGKAKNKAELAKKWGISRGYLYQLAKDC
jgi:DNA invertase Pin-like site-specific DNA recombinase